MGNGIDSTLSIHHRLSKLLADYAEETGIAVTFVEVDWHNTIGGSPVVVKTKIESQTYS